MALVIGLMSCSGTAFKRVVSIVDLNNSNAHRLAHILFTVENMKDKVDLIGF